MASHVQVVLKADVENLGACGELVKVKQGYARNYLVPKGFAAMASKANVESIEHERRMALAKAAKLREAATALAGKIGAVKITITKQIGEEGKLFGSVTTAEIADMMHAEGHEIDRKKIMLDEPIKMAGEHDVKIKLEGGVVATFKVAVVAPE